MEEEIWKSKEKTMETKMRYMTTIAAIISITALEVVALMNHIDGTVFSLVIAAIAGLGGYHLKNVVGNKKEG